MKEQVFSLIDSYREDYIAALRRWVRVPSVKDAPAPGAPFGVKVREMLDLALKDCAALGLPVRDFDGYAMDATLAGSTDALIAVLGHLDVVPAGDGWQVPPFEAVMEGDRMVARGTMDDKGPSLCALFAMRALKEAGVPLKKGIRLILGCDEESGWQDMAYYTAHTDVPEVGFSPDASFPLINTEKAMIHMFLHAPVAQTGLQVKQLWTGERLNVIPGESVCVVEGGEEIVQAVNAYATQTGLPYTAEITAEGVKITAEGIPGHSAYPVGRRSAIGMMLVLLKALGVEGPIKTLAEVYGREHDGASLGIACSDAVSGALTCNMGILHLENGVITASLDCRCPVTSDLDALIAAIKAHTPGFDYTDVSTTAPHHVPEDSELVTTLLAAYRELTGQPASPQYTGGGTYAKVLKSGVAFGASFPDDEDLAHQAGEYADISKLLLATKIYALALMGLCAE